MQNSSNNVVIEKEIIDLFFDTKCFFLNHCACYCNDLFFKKQQNMIVTTLFSCIIETLPSLRGHIRALFASIVIENNLTE